MNILSRIVRNGVIAATMMLAGIVGTSNVSVATPVAMFQELHIGVEIPLGHRHYRHRWHRWHRREVYVEPEPVYIEQEPVYVQPAPIIIERGRDHDHRRWGGERREEHHDNGQHRGWEKHGHEEHHEGRR